MKNLYVMLRPEDFVMHSDIDKYGETDYQPCKPFRVEDPAENCLMFEIIGDRDRESGFCARELVSGRFFDLNVVKPRTEKAEPRILLFSEDFGVYQKDFIKISDIEVKPSRVTGLLSYFNDNEDPFRQYCYEISEFYESARAFKNIYENGIDGPSNYLKRRIRVKFRKIS